MNALAQAHYSAAITGAPPGYVGSKENHTLFYEEKVFGSYSKLGIALFDEIEKARTKVVRALLNVFDAGRLDLSARTKHINFKKSLVFMTSNVGAHLLVTCRKRFNSGWRKTLNISASPPVERSILEDALPGEFDPRFINRIDRILPFNSLAFDWMGQVLDIEITHLNKLISSKGSRMALDPSARDSLLQDFDQRFGARHTSRKYERRLSLF
ncbi:MAG: ATP-dependent Clp protease ATP-binding subunit ClpA [Lentimonas sp.]|jgi:ATP-dependent Clp protease ATP-binding subunit ClpA